MHKYEPIKVSHSHNSQNPASGTAPPTMLLASPQGQKKTLNHRLMLDKGALNVM
jgi:hypothetical protein